MRTLGLGVGLTVVPAATSGGVPVGALMIDGYAVLIDGYYIVIV